VRTPAKNKEPKDTWDKLGVIGQLTSGVLIAALGVLVTVLINRAQQKITKVQMEAANRVANAQLSISERQLTAEYLNKINSAPSANDRANLVCCPINNFMKLSTHGILRFGSLHSE
jgi:hypothetical protein